MSLLSTQTKGGHPHAQVHIREARIDPTLPVNERLRLFAAAIGDPHRFRVGDTEVEVLFDDSAPSLQACLSGMCRQLQ